MTCWLDHVPQPPLNPYLLVQLLGEVLLADEHLALLAAVNNYDRRRGTDLGFVVEPLLMTAHDGHVSA